MLINRKHYSAVLQIKNTAFSQCYRREAGSYGAHVRGLNRLHQFEKVEIVRIEKPGNSYAALEEMVAHVKSILEDSDGIQWEITSEVGGIQHIRGNLTSASDTYKVKVTSSDTPDYISNKLFGGTGIVLSQVDDIDGKKLYISTTSNINSNGKVKVTSAGTLGYLTEKIVAGTSINLTNSADTLIISFNPNIITSAKPFTSAVTVSSTNAIGLIAITLSAGLWELTGGVEIS